MEKLTPFSGFHNAIAAIKSLLDKKANKEDITKLDENIASVKVDLENKLTEATEVDILKLLLELDMLSVVFDENEAMLTDENDAILLV